jgi:formylmethanofuran dehydrogenase subunit E
MSLYYCICKSCNENVEWHRPSSYDGPDVCIECGDIDSLDYLVECEKCNETGWIETDDKTDKVLCVACKGEGWVKDE